MDNKEKITVMWFAYEWDDGFIFFPTQAEAIAYVESQIPLHLDDESREWDENVSLLRVGCITHSTKSYQVAGREHCNYYLAQVLD
jgi:hypothetical protein